MNTFDQMKLITKFGTIGAEFDKRVELLREKGDLNFGMLPVSLFMNKFLQRLVDMKAVQEERPLEDNPLREVLVRFSQDEILNVSRVMAFNFAWMIDTEFVPGTLKTEQFRKNIETIYELPGEAQDAWSALLEKDLYNGFLALLLVNLDSEENKKAFEEIYMAHFLPQVSNIQGETMEFMGKISNLMAKGERGALIERMISDFTRP